MRTKMMLGLTGALPVGEEVALDINAEGIKKTAGDTGNK